MPKMNLGWGSPRSSSSSSSPRCYDGQFPQPGAFIIGPSFLQIHMDVPQTLP